MLAGDAGERTILAGVAGVRGDCSGAGRANSESSNGGFAIVRGDCSGAERANSGPSNGSRHAPLGARPCQWGVCSPMVTHPTPENTRPPRAEPRRLSVLTTGH